MPDLTNIDYENLFCLFKGEPGTRKSTAALSFPVPQYWNSWDLKMDALGLPMRQWNLDPKKIQYDDYTDWDKARIQTEKFLFNPSYNGQRILTHVTDSLTSGSDAINRQTLKYKRKSNEGKLIGGIAVNSIEDFNAEDSALKEYVALLKELNKLHKMNVIIIAHIIQREIKTSDGKTHMSRSLLTAGKGIAQKIPAYCSEVYHFNIKTDFDMSKGGQYALLTTHTGDDFARTSLPLTNEIVFGNEPLYEKWIRPAINKAMNK